MRRNSWWFTVVAAVLGCNVLSIAHAEQIKPYFLVIVDTSGSMAWCSGGTQDNPNADCSCYANGVCGSAFNQNRCGMEANKIGDAKCALQRIIDGIGGDAVFGLMQFQRPCNGCSAAISCASSSDCKDGQLDVAISEGNASLMREWVDNQNQGTCNAGSHQALHELSTGQWTPLAMSLQRANEYLRGTSASFPYATGDSSAPGSPIPASDPTLACRPVSVILLTDGDDTCASNPTTDPPNAAGVLNTGATDATTRSGKAFRTYVIGFGAAQGNFKPEVLDDIAARGGTDSHDTSGHKYFPAMNEEQLSIALNKIIADAQPPVEMCNGKDDDCDGNTDEGLPKFCNKPAGINDPTLCDEPMETQCDGMDDDCDGVIDEGLTNACGSCGDVPKEVCDGFDNDCDQRVDEDTTSNESCGNDKGECQAGKLVCTGGAEQCEGEITGSPEVCDCKDNDCDGNTDEEGTDKLCPSGQRCAGCRCVEFCKQTTEFEPVCPNGLAAEFQPNGECLCIVDNCDHDACPKSTRESGGDVECAPNNPKVATCQCSAGACVSICNGKNCGSGKTCNPRDGRCVEDNCRGLGCTNGEICDPGSGRCEKDACATTTCQSDQVCRGGKCESSCAKVTCGDSQVCKSGECQEDKCTNVSCSDQQTCDPASGECVTDRCAGKNCSTGQVCSVSSGNCEAEPCWNVKCPGNQACIAGECQSASTGSNAEAGSGSEPVKAASRLLATGGGGCACSVPGGGAPRPAPLRGLAAMLGMLLGVVFLQRRRLQRTAAARALWLLAFALALATLGGCTVSPICVDCVDAALTGQPDANSDNPQSGDEGGSGGSANAGAGGNDATDAGMANDAEVDSSTPDASKCMPPGTPETCNDKDDDCDFKVDEDVVPTSNTCNQTGVCAGTTPVCSNGSFQCRFPSTYEMDETLCDGLDNDCDGKVDESFPMLGMPCDVGTGACKSTGTFRCSSSSNGMSCDATPAMPSDEVCNGKDDDCDGMVDEPKGTPGSNPSYVKDALVQVRSDLWIYQYEASRVDADDKTPGIVTTRTCSRAGVLPWTNVTYTEAMDACQSVNMTLCSLDDWMFACQSGSSKDCKWAVPSCSDYDNGTCNGHNPDAQPGDPENDMLKATGSASGCYADFGDAGHVFDMSGNAKEWSTGPNSPSTNPLRGGSYNNDAESLSCTFDFTLGQADLRLPNIGFRCCTNTAP